MSELTIQKRDILGVRWHLLMSASALALSYCVFDTSSSYAVERTDDHPTVWIELGGQLEKVDGTRDTFVQPFVVANAGSAVFSPTSPFDAQHPPRYSNGARRECHSKAEGAGSTL